MRIISKSRKHFSGTHKGHTIEIDKEPDGRFYIIVKDAGGSYAYDGWAPEEIRTMAEAKREAIKGRACDPNHPHRGRWAGGAGRAVEGGFLLHLRKDAWARWPHNGKQSRPI
jgi:hypothetical protein